MERVRMAVIGAGIWGENHAMALSTYPIVDLVCICDLDARRAKALADKVGCEHTTDIEELAASDIVAATIATPDYAHKDPAAHDRGREARPDREARDDRRWRGARDPRGGRA